LKDFNRFNPLLLNNKNNFEMDNLILNKKTDETFEEKNCGTV
jgi:hypothetical protein